MALHARDGQFGLWRGHPIPHAKTDTILNHNSLGTLAWAFYNHGTSRQRRTIWTLAWAFYSNGTTCKRSIPFWIGCPWGLSRGHSTIMALHARDRQLCSIGLWRGHFIPVALICSLKGCVIFKTFCLIDFKKNFKKSADFKKVPTPEVKNLGWVILGHGEDIIPLSQVSLRPKKGVIWA